MLRRRTLLAAALAVTLVVGGPASSGAIPGPDEDAAAAATEAIQAARDRANAAAGDFFAAQSVLEQLESESARLERTQADLELRLAVQRRQVEAIAVNRFLASGSTGIPLLTGGRAPSEHLQVEVLVEVATDASVDSFDEYDFLRAELDDARQAVADNQVRLKEQRAEAARLQRAAEEEVEYLRTVEDQRLRDERIYLAVLAEQAEARRQAEEAARERAAAAAVAQAEADRAAAAAQRNAEEQAAADAAAAAEADAERVAEAAEDGVETVTADAPDALDRPAAPVPEASTGEVAPPEVATEAEAEAEIPDAEVPAEPSGDGDPDDGDGGGGSGLVCPVAGSSSFHDGWGNPRSGGRRHEGVDMMAPIGTPLVAVVAGSATFKQNRLGGNAVWLRGADGHSYYYAHLSSFEGSSRDVGQGEVIGYVGDTGNASGVPHLHFEVHPGGGAAVNPHPSVVAAGC